MEKSKYERAGCGAANCQRYVWRRDSVSEWQGRSGVRERVGGERRRRSSERRAWLARSIYAGWILRGIEAGDRKRQAGLGFVSAHVPGARLRAETRGHARQGHDRRLYRLPE